MSHENETPKTDCCSVPGVVPFPAPGINSTKNVVKAEPEIVELIGAIFERATYYQAQKKRATANNFYNLLPLVNDLNRKLKELRSNAPES